MAETVFATKGNLIAAKNTLELSKLGYELLDKKRNILIREIMELIDIADDIQKNIEKTFKEAYLALQHANVMMGIASVEQISRAIPIEEDITIKARSIMGVEIPIVEYLKDEENVAMYGLLSSTAALDEARKKFEKVKKFTLELAMIENAAYRLAINIKKTQKRANALKNITIPKYEELVKTIQNALEEKDREEFTRLKVIKRRKERE
ncbi:MAG: V-type ATP synthase subunit D [Clostridiaceae bacterium]|nr:V-type ATP synthase subunit D [Clostridiaceae bacterium]